MSIWLKIQLPVHKLFKYIQFFDYYLEIFAKRLSGRGLMNPIKNGEYAVLEGVLLNKKTSVCFIDGGSNVGEHVMKFDFLCKKHGITNCSILSVEPFPSTIEVLKRNLKNISYELVDKALGKEIGTIKFFYPNDVNSSGQNSAFKHYYLSNSIEVEQTTVDMIIKDYSLDRVDFLKLDIEGAEYNALLGAKEALSKGLVDYIQLEYNQTWIEAGGTIQKVLSLAHSHSYELYRIRKNNLLAITKYDFNIEDFTLCNLLLVRSGCALPLTSNRKASPLV